MSIPTEQPAPPPAGRVGLAALVCIIFFNTCGGAFGIEPLISSVGPGWAVALMLVTPLVFCLPMALMSGELVARFPEDGGFYIWVREAFGCFWSVQAGYWSLAFSVLQLATYPVLFVSYLGYVFRYLGLGTHGAAFLAQPGVGWGIAVLVIATATAINIWGAVSVGRYAFLTTAFVVGAFVVFTIAWLVLGGTWESAYRPMHDDFASGNRPALLLGLANIIFNFSGWDNVATFAGEVKDPGRNYPRALIGALILTVAMYVIPVATGLGITSDMAQWTTEAGFPVMAELLAGPGFGLFMAVAALVSMWGLYNAQLLWVSRVPFVMARDGWLPAAFLERGRTHAAPRIAIIAVSCVVAVLAAFSYGDLLVMQSLLVIGVLVLELLALVRLRARDDAPSDRFRVPGGRLGLFYVCVAPGLFSAAVIYATLSEASAFGLQLAFIAAVVVAGLLVYVLRRGRSTDPRVRA